MYLGFDIYHICVVVVVIPAAERYSGTLAMPKCEGRPFQQCSRNDRSVRFTQGDMFLCPECEAFRFPDSKLVAADCFSTGTDPAGWSVVTRSKKAKGKRNVIDNSNNKNTSDEEDLDQCAQCLLPVDKNRCLKCDVCYQLLHIRCTMMTDKLYDQFRAWFGLQ